MASYGLRFKKMAFPPEKDLTWSNPESCVFWTQVSPAFQSANSPQKPVKCCKVRFSKTSLFFLCLEDNILNLYLEDTNWHPYRCYRCRHQMLLRWGIAGKCCHFPGSWPALLQEKCASLHAFEMRKTYFRMLPLGWVIQYQRDILSNQLSLCFPCRSCIPSVEWVLLLFY